MKKGVSIVSLIIYFIGLSIIIGIIGSFNINIFKASNYGIDVARVNAQYLKFNMFFINSVKNGNSININNNVITFLDSFNNQIGQYTFNLQDKTISYTNGGIEDYVVCEFVEVFDVTQGLTMSDGIQKKRIDLNIQIESDSKMFATDASYYLGRGY